MLLNLKTLLSTVRGCQGTQSLWDKCVKQDAIELLESALEEYGDDKTVESVEDVETLLLNGASDWMQYSYGGNHYIYTEDIIKRYSDEVQYDNWLKDNEADDGYWLSVQAKCLTDAMELIRRASHSRYYATMYPYLFYPISDHKIARD